jgi:gas vesicle protein
MDKKILTAAAIAAGSKAMRMEAPANTLAQTKQIVGCSGQFAFECIEEKVDETLAKLIADLEAHKDDCADFMEELGGEIMEEVKEMIEDAQEALEDV